MKLSGDLSVSETDAATGVTQPQDCNRCKTASRCDRCDAVTACDSNSLSPYHFVTDIAQHEL